MRKYLLAIFVACALTKFAIAGVIALKPNAPKTYEVQQGNTLWEIANLYLERPWQWRLLWPEIEATKEPQKLYPGDILELTLHNGEPRLTLSHSGVVKLSPKVRISQIEHAIPTIQLADISPFLKGTIVTDKESFEKLPYVVSFTEKRLTASLGEKIYARGICNNPDRGFSVFRLGHQYVEPGTITSLGYEADELGHAEITQLGDPSVLLVTYSVKAIHLGDRLIAAQKNIFNPFFIPKEPTFNVSGKVISVYGGLTQIGQYQIIAINRGKQDGLEPGHVLSVFQGGEKKLDSVIQTNGFYKIPIHEAATFLVFRVFDKISYGVIMRARHASEVGNIIGNPPSN